MVQKLAHADGVNLIAILFQHRLDRRRQGRANRPIQLHLSRLNQLQGHGGNEGLGVGCYSHIIA